MKTFQPVNVSVLQATWIDNGNSIMASLIGIPRPLVLWSGAAYSAIGDWTQAEAVAQVLTLLSANPTATLQGLF